MLRIAPDFFLDENEISFDYMRASGPGGQNVNKVSSAVQLRLDVRNSPSIPGEVKERLGVIARNRITNEGVLIIEAKQHRTQEQNRAEAMNRLVELLTRAARMPRERKPTKPSVESKKRRLEAKRRRGIVKRMRGEVEDY